jgi:hypothetical protein
VLNFAQIGHGIGYYRGGGGPSPDSSFSCQAVS